MLQEQKGGHCDRLQRGTETTDVIVGKPGEGKPGLQVPGLL